MRSHVANVLRAESRGEDLQDDDGHGIVVCAMRPDGTRYELGRVSGWLALTDPAAAKAAIERIKFAPRGVS